MLREFENLRLLQAPSAADLNKHRVVISDLIAQGEWLAWRARLDKVDFGTVGFQVEDIEAETRLLRDSFTMFHQPLPADKAEPCLEALCGQRAT